MTFEWVDRIGSLAMLLLRMSNVKESSAPDAMLTRLRLALLLIVAAALSFAALSSGGFLMAVSQLMVDGPLLIAWIGACFGIGSVAMRVGRMRAGQSGGVSEALESPVLRVVTRIAIGMGLLSLIVLGLGVVGVCNRLVSVGLILMSNMATVYSIHRHRESLRVYFAARASMAQLPLLLAMPIVAATLLAALVIPWILWGDEPHAYDVVSYHFQLPREWLEQGRITATPHNVFGYFPLNVEMHYLLAMTLRGGATAGMYLAQLMHAAMMILTLAAIYGAVRERPHHDNSSPLAGGTGGGDEARATNQAPLNAPPGAHPDPLTEGERNGGKPVNRAAAVIFAAAFPWMLMLGGVGYNECGVMLFTTLALVWTLRKRFLLAGACAGFAAGCKITSVPTLVALLPVIVFVEALTRRRFEWRGAALLLLGSILTLSPWLIRNAVLTDGNPVFPIAARSLGSAHFDAGMIERFEVAHSARPEQQSLAARAAALDQQVLGDFKFGSLRIRGMGFPILMLLTFAGVALCLRERSAWILASFIIGNSVIWLFSTHLQGRFLVPIIPAGALLVGGVASRMWPMVVIGVSVASMPFSLASVYQRLTAPAAQSGVGFDDPSVFLPESLIKRLQSTDRPVYLIGDARAFLYPVPTSRLHYRTVFDVSATKPFKEAWLGQTPARDAIVVVAPSELERFEKTYRNLPKMPTEWRGRGMFLTDVELKTMVPLE